MKIKIIIEEKVEKKISRLDLETKKRVDKVIKNLETNIMPKNPKHILATKKNSFLCETGFEILRLYYRFTFEKIIVYKY